MEVGKMVQYLARLLQEFKRDDRGAFSLFMIAIFTTMVLVGGAAIDLVRFEAVRSSIQYNLDRAVLAAASMRQTQDPATVVNDYMSKVETLSTFNVTIDGANTSVTLTGRRVSANATATLSTYFLRIAGINTMDVSASSRASEEIPNIEISMVLDVSGSMSGSKISSLKTAAKTFVDTVVIPDDDSLTAISIVPYSTNVSLPQTMWDAYTTEGLSTKSRCMIFESADYNQAAISTSTTQRQLPYYSWRAYLDSNSTLDYSDCRGSVSGGSYADIMPFSVSTSDLKTKIDSLVATGSTAAHIGTKWGVALLDPAAKPIAAAIGGEVANLPASYTEPGVLKVLLVMTDGQNTNHYELYNQYRSGASDMTSVLEQETVCDESWKVWYYENYGWYGSDCSQQNVTNYYLYRPDNSKYYKLGDGTSQGSSSSSLPGNNAALSGAVGYRYNFTWTEVWEFMSTEAFARTIGKSWSDIERVYSTASQADTQMTNSCASAKNNGVVVYSIAFEAPQNAQDLLKECATSNNNYYDVDTTDIASAFAAIAVSIQKLKLTQ
jgi:Flp pilus assembly protein TadG